MSKTYEKYLALVAEEQYMIPGSDTMAKIMGGAKQVQIELFKDKEDGLVKMAVRADGKIRVVAGDLAVNSVRALEKISGRKGILDDFLQFDTEKAMTNPTRDHASHGGFDITITSTADGGYRMTFTAPDAKTVDEKEPTKRSRYISRNDFKDREEYVEAVMATYMDDAVLENRGSTYRKPGEGVAAVRKLFLEVDEDFSAEDAEIDRFLDSYCDELDLGVEDVLDSRGASKRDAAEFYDDFKSFSSKKGSIDEAKKAKSVVLTKEEAKAVKEYVAQLKNTLVAGLDDGNDPEDVYDTSYTDLRVEFGVDWKDEDPRFEKLADAEDAMLAAFRKRYARRIAKICGGDC